MKNNMKLIRIQTLVLSLSFFSFSFVGCAGPVVDTSGLATESRVSEDGVATDEDLSLEDIASQEAPANAEVSSTEAADLEQKDRDESVASEMEGKASAVVDVAQTAAVEDITTYSNKKIEAFIHMYTHRKRDVFEQAVQRSAIYMPMIRRIFVQEGLPVNLAYLAVVESNFNPVARSHANAVGLWQFMSYTGRSYGLSNSWWHDERFDPEKSTHAAAKYLKNLYREFGSWELALAAYNSGSGRVRGAIRRAKRLGKDTDYWSLKLPRETRGYVPTFFAATILFENLESYSFAQPPALVPETPRYALAVPGGVTLGQIAKATGFDAKELSKLNPSIPRGLTPAHYETYEILVPKPYHAKKNEFSSLETNRKRFWKTHKVRSGDTLWGISRKYGVPISQIVSFNQISKRRLLRVRQKIMLPVPSNYTLPQYRRTVVASSSKRHRNRSKKRAGYTYYKVKSGDSLWSISQAHNVSLRQIKKWNRSKARRWKRLKVGSTVALKISKRHNGG